MGLWPPHSEPLPDQAQSGSSRLSWEQTQGPTERFGREKESKEMESTVSETKAQWAVAPIMQQCNNVSRAVCVLPLKHRGADSIVVVMNTDFSE